MNGVTWTQSAVDDLNAIRERLSEISPDIAQDIIDRLILSARWLVDAPSAGPAIWYGRWRKWNPRRTGYVLIYEPDKAGIQVVRVRHARENWPRDDI